MRLTQEQREEGRRLLTARNECGMSYEQFMQASNKLSAWLYNHSDALLADPEIDVEAIKREAVSGFALRVLREIAAEAPAEPNRAPKDIGEHARSVIQGQKYRAWMRLREIVKELAAARGVNLDETARPVGEAEGGES